MRWRGTKARRVAPVISMLLLLASPVLPTARASGPGEAFNALEAYRGGYFGENNFPPGCTRDFVADNPANVCYHMKDLSKLNPLDSAKIDVLILVPLSPTAERDMRILRQAVAMWDGGIHYLGPKMGLPWLEDVQFRVTVDYVDLSGSVPKLAVTPVVDPEIVMIAANPVSPGAGLGEDPLSWYTQDGVPCHPVKAPFDIAAWQALPGFDNHDDPRAGTYDEACGGAGGNTCFAIMGAWDPDPSTADWYDMFYLASHEFGHCLTLGHVGDGAEKLTTPGWGPVPFDEIMSYTDDSRLAVGGRPAPNRCASTLDVEVFALRMSHYLDRNQDGKVDARDVLVANDQIGVDGYPLQVQNPSDYLFASSTGAARDCPQPDLGLLPGARTNWVPTAVPSRKRVVDVTSPGPGATTLDDSTLIRGTVSERGLDDPPTSTTAAFEDNPGDASSPYTEILSVDADANDTDVRAVLHVSKVWPTSESPFSYSLSVNEWRFDSFVIDPKQLEPQPLLWDGTEYVPGGSTTWDVTNGLVTFSIPRAFLRRNAIRAPYQIGATANIGPNFQAVDRDDWAPEQGSTIGITAPPEKLPPAADNPSPDDDSDGVPDTADACPEQPGLTADGCTARVPTQVRVSVDGRLSGTQDVYADHGPARFALPVSLTPGQHSVVVTWVDGSTVLARHELTITRRPGGTARP